eukprot:COSAG02_NODE_7072_length_3199_cov_528.647419_3_plen_43_part_00
MQFRGAGAMIDGTIRAYIRDTRTYIDIRVYARRTAYASAVDP